jgi:hypothetical protein
LVVLADEGGSLVRHHASRVFWAGTSANANTKQQPPELTVEFHVCLAVVYALDFTARLCMHLISIAQHRGFTSRVSIHDPRRIVNLPINYNPAVIFLIMLLNLLPRKLLLRCTSRMLGNCHLVPDIRFYSPVIRSVWLHRMAQVIG